MSEKRDYYEVLGVAKEATSSDLKNAFRSLARKYHPDRSEEENAEDMFKEIQEAYAVLSDDEKRAQYDRFGHNGPGGSPFGGFGGGGFNINLEDILGGDFFSNIFGGGGGGGRRARRRGSDIRMYHTVDLEKIYRGSTEEVEVELPVACTQCAGTGAKDGAISDCGDCSGQGRVRMRQQVGPFVQDVVRECPTCDGAGHQIDERCSPCRGNGKEIKTSTLRFNIPAGAEAGTRLRMRGKGEPAPNGKGEDGDLFIEIDVDQHLWFERSNADLIMSLPLGYSDLVLGTSVSVEHIDGKELVIKIPPYSNSGDTIEIKKRGLPRNRGSGRGDVIVLLKLHMPKKVDKKSKKSLQDLKSVLGPKDLLERIKQDAKERRN
ncbi:MAG: molecular chaperone DnaJ [Euryarchaeota archaeon]|mgnify:FL=1|jgi:molecular chaperone DnaJ|nr:molecular chaperone DnaJ [Euryarchaeota archaeon]MBT5595000.1 molecular chaperone DnaJ [Euryarchaeota archaeon]MBT5844874.1 molecular chaperone DnaJ [Euryarchaeota archaeon]MBT6640230.1 molecular chaperone DnaJ [Euryarchaeota archaeon]MBT6845343.1 molecular chaperone DnaJ [Euryarchaeota archaeon]